MKKYLLTTLALIVMAAFVCAATKDEGSLTQARLSYKQKLFTKAAEQYAPLLKSKDNETRWEAQLKTVLSLYFSHKYDQALTAIFSFTAPKDKLWAARYYYLKYTALAISQSVYRSSDLQESETDPTRFTFQQSDKERRAVLTNLWDIRKQLVDFRLKDSEDYLITSYRRIDRVMTPSLFDLYADLWLQNNIKPQADIMEEGYKLKGTDRDPVREIWNIKRLSLTAEDKTEEEKLPLADCLYYVAGGTDKCEVYKDIKPFIFTAKEIVAQAYAADESANIYLAAKEYQKAADSLDYCLRLPLNYFSQSCKSTKNMLEAERIAFEKAPNLNVPAGEDTTITVNTSNLKKFYVKIYPLSPRDFSRKCYTKSAGDCWSTVKETARGSLAGIKPSRVLEVEVRRYKKYEPMSTEVTIPYISDGFYAVVISDSQSYKDNDKTIYLNFTDLAAFATSFKTLSKAKGKASSYKNYFNVYTVDAKTGALRKSIKLFSNQGEYKTGMDGQVLIEHGRRHVLSLLAQDYGNNAIIPNMYAPTNVHNDYQIITNTDRAIYRPGQEVKFAFTVIENDISSPTPYSGKDKLEVTIMSSAWKDLAKETLSLDSMGSGEYSFKIPADVPLGNLTAEVNFKAQREIYSVSVEEYKRPEFEVNLKDNTKAVSYDKAFTVEGNAKYYYGNAVPNAKVKYSIEKQYFIPWFCWYFPQRESRQENIEGSTVTDKNGNFKIVFTPTEDKDNKEAKYPLPQRYEITVFVTDEGGRTISDSKRYTVSRQQKFFAIKSEHGFFEQDKEGALFVQMVNADEAPLEGNATATIYYAEPEDTTNISLRDTDKLNNFKEGRPVKSFDVKFTADGPEKVTLPALKESFYIIKFTTPSSNGQENEGKFTFMVVNPKDCKLDLPSVAIAENKVYYPGQTARVIVGATKAGGNKYLEIYKNEKLIGQQTITQKGAAIISIPIKTSHSGGITLGWFAAYNMQWFEAKTSLEIPYNNSQLNLNVLGSADNLPDAKVNWTIEAKDEKGNPVNARAFVTAYDKSLDYYTPYEINIPQVYDSKDNSPANTDNSLESGTYHNFTSPLHMSFEAAPASGFGGAPVMRAALSKEAIDSAVMDYGAKEIGITDDAQQMPSSSVKIRDNFAETALWAPRIDIKNGIAPLVFTMPQKFTEWSLAAYAFTKDIKTGKTNYAFRTGQDLMVRLETPRFLREGDKFELRAMVTNNSAAVLPVALELSTKLGEDDAKDLLGIKSTTAEIRLQPSEQKFISWPITAPQGSGVFSFTIVAKAAGLSDGEVKTFPLLPSAQRLSESNTLAISDGKNSLSLDNLADKDIKLEAVHLSIEPSLLMPVLNAMPLLTYDNQDTVTGLLNSYLPLAILNELYNKYPQVKEAADKLPARDTQLPAWNSDEKMLMTELAKSPWYTLSKGYKTDAKTINMFDAKLVASQRASVLGKLKDYQNSDGGFSWIKGGKSSPFITLYVLDTMAKAANFGVNIPASMVKKALAYSINNTTLDVISPSYENITASLYLAYVLTSFPNDYYKFDVKKLINTADEFAAYMTPIGKAYAAIVCERVGYKDRAALYVERLLDSAKTSPVTGMYFAPEERSWMWYNDTITQQVAVIQALQTVNAKDPRIKDLVKWLIFNRKTDQWGNSEEAAKAVYAILGVMDSTSALSQTKTFNIDWGGQESILEVKPYDTLNPNFTFSKYGEEASVKDLSATITKKAEGGKDNTSLDDFASLTAMFVSSAVPQQSPAGLMNISKQMFLVKDKKAVEIKDGTTVNVGDEIEVRLTVDSQTAFSFVNIMDAKPAAFEADALLSGWRYDKLYRYEEIRDNATNFFMDWLPNGTYELKYTLRPTTAGEYRVGAAVMQSMFAPEFTAHSQGFVIKVK